MSAEVLGPIPGQATGLRDFADAGGDLIAPVP